MKKTYQNPLKISGIGDPFILRASDGIYYLYATSAKDGFLCWSSENLIDWEERGYCYRADDSCWGQKWFWAPECYEINGKFYFFYSAHDKENPNNELENFCLGVGVSESPTGPFEDISDRPLLKLDYPIIDVDLARDDKGNVLSDEAGNFYLYFSRCCYNHKVGDYEESHIYGILLAPDCSHCIGEPKLLLKPDQEWESWSAPTTGRRWTEGPLVIKRQNKYYMMYSANFFEEKYYGIGCAVADNPFGPYVKYDHNPIMSHDYPRVSGPGHNSVAWSPDGSEMFVCYHVHTSSAEGGGNRQVCIDRMGFDENGVMWCSVPTTDDQPFPSGAE
jgi:GH43 family beta-xylosidase